MYVRTPATGVTTAHIDRGKDTLLGRNKGGGGGINPWLNNSPFKAHSEGLLLSI